MRDQSTTNSATKNSSKLDQVLALVDELPQDMYLWGDIHNASPAQMDQLKQLFTTIYRIHDLLGSTDDSDPDVNAVMVNLPALILTEDFDAWMALFLENASAFSSTFVGALDGFLAGCDVFSILFRGLPVSSDCIRLLKNSDAKDILRTTVTSYLEATSKSLPSSLESEVISEKTVNSDIVGLETNQSNIAHGVSNVVGHNAGSDEILDNPSKLADTWTNKVVNQDIPAGIEHGFTVVKNRGRGTSINSGGKIPPKILAHVPGKNSNSFGPLASHLLDDEDDTEGDAAYKELEAGLLQPPTRGVRSFTDIQADTDEVSLDDDLSLSQTGKSFPSPNRPSKKVVPDLTRMFAKFDRMETNIANLIAERDSYAVDAIASYKASLRKEFDSYVQQATDEGAIKFSLKIKEKETIAAQFLAGLSKSDARTQELKKLTTLASQSIATLQNYNTSIAEKQEFMHGLSDKIKDMEHKLQGYNEEFALLDEKLLMFSKKMAGVSDNSHLEHLQSQLKGSSSPAPPFSTTHSGAMDNWGPEVMRKSAVSSSGNSQDDISIQVEDVTVTSLENSTVKHKKRAEFLETSGGKVLIPADIDELIRVKSPKEDMSDKVYVYKVQDEYIANWHNSDTKTSIYPLHTWVQFELEGQLVWAFIEEYEFTSQAPIYCVSVNENMCEVHAADVIRHAMKEPQFANATATPVRPQSSNLHPSFGDRVSTSVSPAKVLRQTKIEDCRPFYVDTTNLQNDTRYPPTPVHSLVMNTGPPQIKSNEYIHPFDPLHPRVSSVTSIKNLSTSSLQSRLVPLSGIGVNSNCREFFTHIKNLMEDLNVPLRSFDDFVKFEDMDQLLDCDESTTHGFSNLQLHASKLLYQIFAAEKSFLLPDDEFSSSSFATYLDSRDGLTFFSKLLKRHHPILSEKGVKEIPFGPKFDMNTMTIHEYATELIKFKRIAPGYTEADVVVHFLRTIDERFKDAKGSLLAIIHRLCQNSRDTVLPHEYTMPQIASTVIERCTTDRVQQNILSGLPSVTPTTATAYSAQINSFDRRPSTSQKPFSKPFSPDSSTSSNSRQTSTSNGYTPRKLCPCCQSFCKDRCLNLGRLLAIQDYQKRFPNLDWTKLLNDFKENQRAFRDKINRTYTKRKRVRVNRMELVQQLREDSWPEDFVQARVDEFIQREIADDPELLFCSADVNLSDEDEPIISM